MFEGLGRLTEFLHEAYNMSKRWIREDKPFPNTQLFNNALQLQYFEPKKNTTEMIPGGHLRDTSGEAVSKLSTAAATEFLKTRLVCGLSSLNAKDLRALVLHHVKMEQMASPLITGTHNLSVELLSFMAGHVHAKDVAFFNIPQSLPLHQYWSWAVPGDREKLKKIVAFTSEEVFEAWSPTTLVDKTQKDTLAFMNKAIRMKCYRGELAHLTDQQVASFSFCEVEHPTNAELCFQFSRMAIPASLGEKAHQAFVVTVAKIDENGSRHNQNLIGGHCSCKGGIAGRDIHTLALLFLQNNLNHLKIPSDNIACTAMLCQWIIPSSGPTADVKVPMELQVVSGKSNLDPNTGMRKKVKQPQFGRGVSLAKAILPPYNPSEEEVMKYLSSSLKRLPKFRITEQARKKRCKTSQLEHPNDPRGTAIEALFYDALYSI